MAGSNRSEFFFKFRLPPKPKPKKEDAYVAYLDYDGTLTRIAGKKFTESRFYKELNHSNPDAMYEQIKASLIADSNSPYKLKEGVLFFLQELIKNKVEINIVSRNTKDYIYAAMKANIDVALQQESHDAENNAKLDKSLMQILKQDFDKNLDEDFNNDRKITVACDISVVDKLQSISLPERSRDSTMKRTIVKLLEEIREVKNNNLSPQLALICDDNSDDCQHMREAFALANNEAYILSYDNPAGTFNYPNILKAFSETREKIKNGEKNFERNEVSSAQEIIDQMEKKKSEIETPRP